MRHGVLPVCVGLAAAMIDCAALAQAAGETEKRAVTKRAALSGFSFEEGPAPSQSGDLAPALNSTKEASADPEVVVMKEVRITPLSDWDLSADIKKTRPLKAHSVVKYGTGVHEKDFGKIRAGVVTILYVPVLVGFAW